MQVSEETLQIVMSRRETCTTFWTTT